MAYSRLLRSGAVDAAGTVNTDIEANGLGAKSAALYGLFDYGSGGTTIKVYLQGSYDQGTTWVPIANMTFATADDAKLINIVPVSFAATDVDAAQADNAQLSHLAPRLRVSIVTTGTYAASTLAVWFHMAE